MRLHVSMLAGVLLLPACASTTTIRGTGGYCAPQLAATEAVVVPDPSVPGASREEQAAALIGLRSVVPVAHAGPVDVATRLAFVERIDRARLTMAATVAELDCESSRARVAAEALTRTSSSQVQSLTFWSIAAAAATGIAAAFLSTRNASDAVQDGVAVGGGLVTAGFGIASLYVKPTITFSHTRNLLADVWNGPSTSTTYPPFLWAYLTRDEYSSTPSTTIRANLVERWHHLESIGDAVTVLVGRGGTYDVDALSLRAAMLDDVRAEISLANQDLAAVAAQLLGSGSSVKAD